METPLTIVNSYHQWVVGQYDPFIIVSDYIFQGHDTIIGFQIPELGCEFTKDINYIFS